MVTRRVQAHCRHHLMTQQVFNNIIHDLTEEYKHSWCVPCWSLTYGSLVLDSVVLSVGGETCFNLLHSRLQAKQNYRLGHYIQVAVCYQLRIHLYPILYVYHSLTVLCVVTGRQVITKIVSCMTKNHWPISLQDLMFIPWENWSNIDWYLNLFYM